MRNITLKCKISILLLLALSTSSCEDFIVVDVPNSQISNEIVFENDETAIASANGMYNAMLQSESFIGGSFNPISYIGGLSSDELDDYTGTAPYSEFYHNQLNVNNSTVLSIWSSAYNTIYEANAVIEGVTSSNSLSQSVKAQLIGEAKFVRAFCHFYLVNLFGDAPLVNSTDYRRNATLDRTSISEVYELIESDLLEAKELLTEDYFLSEKVRPNKWAAIALLARVYLYRKNFVKAESEASSVISSSMYSMESDLNNVFIANCSEAILQLSKAYPDFFPTADGQTFYISSLGPTKTLGDDFLNSFDSDDMRRDSWVNSKVLDSVTYYYPYKYKLRAYTADANYPEYLMLLRLGEQYLIRAEARMEQGDLDGAKGDLNVVRDRAGLDDTDATDQASLRLAIEQERRFELFCEMGHRWLDLKRTNRANVVLGSLKALWNSTDVLYPIPEQEMLNNPKLTPQNDGY